MSKYGADRKRQLQCEIDWLKNKLKSVKKEKHRKELLHQIEERELNLSLGLFAIPKQPTTN